MEWKETILRKVTISKKRQKNISNERYMHITRLELNNTSIQETEIFIDKMTRDRSQNRNQACLNFSEAENSYPQVMDDNNTVSNRDCNMVANNNVQEGNEEVDDCFSDSHRNDDASPNLNEKLNEVDASLSDADKSKIICEKVEMDCIRLDKKNEVDDSDRKSENTDASEKLGNNAESAVSDISETYFKTSNRVKIKIGSTSCLMENFNCPTTSLNKFKFSPNQGKSETINHDVEDIVTETGAKPKIDYLNNDDANNNFFTDVLRNEDGIMQQESGLLKSHCSSMGVNRKYPTNLTEESKERKKHFAKRNIQIGNREDLKNNIKKSQSSVTFFENEIKGKETDEVTCSKSVIDLIAYFESLNISKQSNVEPPLKSNKKQSTSKQDIKIQKIMKSNQDIESNTNQPLSAQQYTKINPKAVGGEKSLVKKSKVTSCDVDVAYTKRAIEFIPENFQPNVTSHNGKRSAEISPENDLPNLNTRIKVRRTEEIPEESLSVKTNETKKTTKTNPEPITLYENMNVIDVRKRLTETASKANLTYLNARKSRYRMSLTTKPGTCAFCKGKCVHIDRSVNHPKSNEVKIKEHVFIFSDEVHKNPKNSRNPTCFQSSFTPNNIKSKHQLCFNESDKAKIDDKIRLCSDANKTRKNGSCLSRNPKHRTVNLSSTKNRLPFTQNSTQLQKHEKNHLSERNKRRTPERHPYLKRFVGTLLTVIVFTGLYKGISKNYSLW